MFRYFAPCCFLSSYRGGPIMLAILVVMGTKYACNLSQDGDHICLQSWFKRGPNMPAISVSIGTIYACNRICWGPYMPAISKIFKTPWKWSSWVKKLFKNFRDCRHIWSPTDTITGIYGLCRNWQCRHIWSPWNQDLQAYMVPILTEIAGIFHHR